MTTTVPSVPPFVDTERLLKEKATSAHYRRFTIPKFKRVKGVKVEIGRREIVAPIDELKRLQKALIAELLRYGVSAHGAAHAYIKRRGIKSNAQLHLRKARRLRIDVKDFFPSITRNLVVRNFPRTVPRTLVVMISNWCFLNGALPQGAPSSPVLSNIAMSGIDATIAKTVRTWRGITSKSARYLPEKKIRTEPITYTRYCDDLVFSSNYPYLYDIVPLITKLLDKCGLVVNPKKTHCAYKSARQVVTGIVVNDKLSVPRYTRNLLRARLHNMILDTANGLCGSLHYLDNGEIKPMEADASGNFFSVLEGQVTYVASICKEQAVSLERQLRVLKEVHTLPAERWSEETNRYCNDDQTTCNT